MENGFQGQAGQQVPEMTDEIVDSISNRYIELYEHITGEKFIKSDTTTILQRVENNILKFLNDQPIRKLANQSISQLADQPISK